MYFPSAPLLYSPERLYFQLFFFPLQLKWQKKNKQKTQKSLGHYQNRESSTLNFQSFIIQGVSHSSSRRGYTIVHVCIYVFLWIWIRRDTLVHCFPCNGIGQREKQKENSVSTSPDKSIAQSKLQNVDWVSIYFLFKVKTHFHASVQSTERKTIGVCRVLAKCTDYIFSFYFSRHGA